MRRIVLNIPHSSCVMPQNTWIGDIEPEIEKWTDWYTDLLFTPQEQEECIAPVVFPYSRFYCDVERLPENEPLEAIGQGVFYTKFNDCVRLKTSALSNHVATLHAGHLNMLSQQIVCHDTLLIDCHSFPEEIAPDVDICIGWNEDDSKPSSQVLQLIKTHFEENGYSVSFNYPYSNSITPPSAFKYQSVMIELNKRLYLTDGKAALPAFNNLHNCIQRLYSRLLLM